MALSMATAGARGGRAGRRVKGCILATLILSYCLNFCEARWVSLCLHVPSRVLLTVIRRDVHLLLIRGPHHHLTWQQR